MFCLSLSKYLVNGIYELLLGFGLKQSQSGVVNPVHRNHRCHVPRRLAVFFKILAKVGHAFLAELLQCLVHFREVLIPDRNLGALENISKTFLSNLNFANGAAHSLGRFINGRNY